MRLHRYQKPVRRFGYSLIGFYFVNGTAPGSRIRFRPALAYNSIVGAGLNGTVLHYMSNDGACNQEICS